MKQRVRSMYGYALRHGVCSLDEIPQFFKDILEEDISQDALDELISSINPSLEPSPAPDASAGMLQS